MRDDLEQARARVRLDDFQGAIVILHGRADAPSLLLLGQCQESVGDREGAARTWARLPGDASARLRAGRAEAELGHHAAAKAHLRAGVDLVRNEVERFAEPERLLHDLLVAWSEVSYRTDGSEVSERLLGEAARAWPSSPYPLVLLARRTSDADAARRLLTTALARVPPADLPDFLTRECAVAAELSQGPAILEILLTHGLSRRSHDEALNVWRTRHRLPR
ncbi:MAG: hypothetical protein ABIS86_10140 [Streptosporangiaceae bacterium]